LKDAGPWNGIDWIYFRRMLLRLSNGARTEKEKKIGHHLALNLGNYHSVFSGWPCLFDFAFAFPESRHSHLPIISYSKPPPPAKPARRKLSIPQQQQDYVPPNGTYSPSDQDRPPSSAFLNRLAETMRDKRSQLEVRKDEFMSETLPEWKVRGAEFSSMAKETGMEWSKRGRDAVDRWKKDRMSKFITNLV
jgi:hypothetical protein